MCYVPHNWGWQGSHMGKKIIGLETEFFLSWRVLKQIHPVYILFYWYN